MAGELGLKNTLKARIYGPLQDYRNSDRGGKEISFIDFAQTRAFNEANEPVGLLNTEGNPITWDDIWNDLGIDPSRITLENLLTTSGSDTQYLVPELVREFILLGLEADAGYRDLVAGTENVSSMVITMPWISMDNTDPEAVAEAETIPESAMSWGHKTIELAKVGKAIHFSDELLLRCPLPLLQYWMRRFGTMLSAMLYTNGVSTMINGDQADSSDTCAVVGVESTTNGITFIDFLRAWIRARRIFMGWNNMVTSEAGAWSILQLDEFASPQGLGGTVVQIESRNRVIPARMPHLISAELNDDQALLYDQARTMVFLVFRPLLVESERIIMRQIQGTAASLICGFATLERAARIILDGGEAYSGAGFPSYMAPLV